MCLAVSWGMADGGVDLVRMIPRGHGGGAELPSCTSPFICSHLHL